MPYTPAGCHVSTDHYPEPQDVFSVSFFSTSDGQLRGTSLTHENITAGVTSTRALLPLSGAISPLDTIVSAHTMSSAFGRAVAYTALFEGTNFATLKSSQFFGASTSKFTKTFRFHLIFITHLF